MAAHAARLARRDAAGADDAPGAVPPSAVPVSSTSASAAGGAAEILRLLWGGVLKYDAADPSWPDRDRLVLAGHATAARFAAMLAATGSTPPIADPLLAADRGGTETSVSPARLNAGLGLGAAVGLAAAERLLAARFGRSLIDHRTWVLVDPDDLASGLGQEALDLAARLHLSRLVVVLTADDPAAAERPARQAQATGWAVRHAPPADPAALPAALSFALRGRRPTLIVCPAGGETDTRAREAADQVSDAAHFHAAGARAAPARRAWLRRLAQHPLRDEHDRTAARRRSDDARDVVSTLRKALAATLPAPSPAAAAREVLDGLMTAMPEMVALRCTRRDDGGSPVPAETHRARTLECGACTAGLGAILLGLSVHGGLVPVAWTSAEASDGLRPALRLAARRQLPVTCFLTEDGHGAESDGLLASLRAIPNLLVLRPADAVETADCCDLALRRADGPCVVVLGTAPVPALPRAEAPQPVARGGYIVSAADGMPEATLIATGVDVAVARAAQAQLAVEGIPVAVAALPCWELFAAQDETYRRDVLGPTLRVGIERGTSLGWERWLGADGAFVDPTEAAAVQPDQSFGISCATVIDTVRTRVINSRGTRS